MRLNPPAQRDFALTSVFSHPREEIRPGQKNANLTEYKKNVLHA